MAAGLIQRVYRGRREASRVAREIRATVDKRNGDLIKVVALAISSRHRSVRQWTHSAWMTRSLASSSARRFLDKFNACCSLIV